MTRLVLALLACAPAAAFADPDPPMLAPPGATGATSPWGSSPYVVAYQPPPIESRIRRGLTLEISAGAGTTTVDASAGAGTFAIGGWLTRDVTLALRVTAVGSLELVAASAQIYASPRLWFGAGVAAIGERGTDVHGGTTVTKGTGGFGRVGFNIATSGAHALYLSAEGQGGSVDGELRMVGLLAIGYQLL